MDKSLLEAVKKRRTVYDIEKEINITDEQLEEIINECLLYSPTGFNAQSDRIILALGEKHEEVWDLITESVEAVTDREALGPAIDKINKLRGGYGTVLFFEDKSVIKRLQKQFTDYASYFQSWSQQGNGMLQYLVWVALAQEGIGASLQHYNVLIVKEIRKMFDLPDDWFLVSQMPFGIPKAVPSNRKTFPREGKVRVER
ncbi:MAG: nitroreductase family protein [Andreesenia angusta]|nr:nitroreductase family protein [Andreesenia angusta]